MAFLTSNSSLSVPFYSLSIPSKTIHSFLHLKIFFLCLVLLAGVALPVNAQVTVSGATPSAINKGYALLEDAFAAINSNSTQTGNNIFIAISTNINEGDSAVLNAGNWTSLTIYPKFSGVVISGPNVGPVIKLNGADNVTIDGRVNKSGTTADMEFVYNKTNKRSYELLLTNSAQNNLIQYCKFMGCVTDLNGGIITFYSTAGTVNQNNTITHCEIMGYPGYPPYYAIYSGGTKGSNTLNTISNNLFHDVLNDAASSSDIYIGGNSDHFMINGNSFYEPSTVSAESSGNNYAFVSIVSGDSYYIANNYMGGQAAFCGGSALILTPNGSSSPPFYPIYLNVGTANASTVIGNTIQNITYTAVASNFSAINVAAGQVNVYNNIIGAATGTNSIQIISIDHNLPHTSYGIFLNNNSSTVTISNNIIGSINTINKDPNIPSFSSQRAQSLYAIYIPATTGNVTISGNTINSIQTSGTSTADAQKLYGIFAKSSGTVTISANTIANLTNSSADIDNTDYSLICGIKSANSILNISNNVIHDLTIAAANNYPDSVSVSGIALDGTSTRTVIGNTIYNLFNTYASFAGNVVGLYYNGGTAGNTVSTNFITGLSVNAASSANLYGIKIASGATTYSNNIISLGGNTATTIYGIYESGASGNNNNLYFNTVYIGGNPTSGARNSYALYSAVTTNTRNFRNNLLDNARSNSGTASGKHYAAYFAYGVNSNLTLNYNDYYAPGTNGKLGYYNNSDITALPIVTGNDVNSQTVNPFIVNAGTTLFATDYRLKATSTLAAGITVTGITADYGAMTRAVTPTMGAWEIIFNLWTGNSDSNWNTPGNWTKGVPLPGDIVEFATTNNNGTATAKDLVLNGNYTIGNLINMSTNRLVIPTGYCLTVTNSITTNGTADQIYIQTSASTGINGSLIFHNPVSSPVSATVDMYSKASWDMGQAKGSQYRWQFFGIPLRTVIASTFVNSSYVRQMHENDNPVHWEQLIISSPLSSFTGYEITQSAGHTYIFKGQLENSDYPTTQQPFTSTVSYPGQSLIGNPYTAAIDISKIAFGLGMLQTVYLYNTGTYHDWSTQNEDSLDININAGQYSAIPWAHAGDAGLQHQIPSMQAFLVKAKSLDASATIAIPYSAVSTVVANSVAQRAPNKEKVSTLSDSIYTIIDVKGSRFSDRMWIFTDPNCTHGFDNGWDGEKFIGSKLTPQLYAMETDGIYQVNSVDDMNNTYLGFRAGEDSIYTLTFTHQNLGLKYTNVYLVDSVAQQTVNITPSGTQYTFRSLPTDTIIKRFKIITNPEISTAITAPVTKNSQLKVFSSNHTVFIDNPSDYKGSLSLYDTSGRIIRESNFTANGVTTIRTDLIPGSYLIKATTKLEKVTKNIIL